MTYGQLIWGYFIKFFMDPDGFKQFRISFSGGNFQ